MDFDEAPESFTAPAHPYDEAHDAERREQHPAVTLAQDFLTSLINLQKQQTTNSGFATTLLRGSMDIVGGHRWWTSLVD
jgi:hypothetical protein